MRNAQFKSTNHLNDEDETAVENDNEITRQGSIRTISRNIPHGISGLCMQACIICIVKLGTSLRSAKGSSLLQKSWQSTIRVPLRWIRSRGVGSWKLVPKRVSIQYAAELAPCTAKDST